MKLFPNSMAHIIMPVMLLRSEIDTEIEQVLRKGFDITLTDFQTLLPIAVLTTCTQKDIALFNLVSEASVSRKIQELISRGLVVKKQDQHDARKSLLSLTTKGRLMVIKLQARVIKRMEQVFAELPKETRREVSDGLQKMVRLLAKKSPRRESLLASKNPVLRSLLDSK